MSGPILVVMAAGLGSRFGGPKQVEPVGAHGEILLDYSVFDAKRAGFRRVIFVVSEGTEPVLKERAEGSFGREMDVSFVRQEITDLPAGFSVPQGRTKPWGTAHAVYACRHLIDAPFVVINADDYYGPESFSLLYQGIKSVQEAACPARYLMAGFRLENTLTENGHVARGVCQTDEAGFLTTIIERTYVVAHNGGAAYSTDGGSTLIPLTGDTTVSMNCWCFPPSFIGALEEAFPGFLHGMKDPIKGEFFLPDVVRGQMDLKNAQVQVLPTMDKWYGVTYREDKKSVVAAIEKMTKTGLYPAPLWGEARPPKNEVF